MAVPDLSVLLAYLVIIAVPAHWIVVGALWRLLRARPDNLVLRDRFLVAVFLASLVTMFGLVFINNDIIPPPFTVDQTRVVTRTMVLLSIVPSLYWLWLYRSK